MKFNLKDNYDKAAKEYGFGKGEFYKITDGENRMRLASILVPHQSEYQGRKTFKWVGWVIDRKDGIVKPYFMPNTIYRAIEALQLSVDYGFDEVPMPYDLTIFAKNAGSLEVEYQVLPSPKLIPLTADELIALEERMPITEFVEKLSEKQGEKQPEKKPLPHKIMQSEQRDEEIRLEDVPF